MPEPLTQLERRILDYLVDYLRRNTYQPSIREIGRRFDIKSTKTVSEYLQSLADKGWIERDPSRSRGVRLLGVDLNAETVTVPWYGAVSPDGLPLQRDGIVDELELDRRLAGGSGAFLLGMRGESMEGAGIRDGDLLLVEPATQEELEEGDIAVGRVDGQPVVQRFHRRGKEIVLEPANVNFPATLLTGDEDSVMLGRVTAVFRRVRQPAAAAASVGGGEREAVS